MLISSDEQTARDGLSLRRPGGYGMLEKKRENIERERRT